MDNLTQRRCASAATLALIALAGYWQAIGISALCRAELSGPRPLGAVEVRESPVLRATLETDHATSARSLIEHNPFDSTSPRPLDAPVDPRVEPFEPSCQGLKATLVAAFEDEPLWSLVAVTSDGETKPHLLHVGDPISGRAVRAVEWNRVVLAKDGASCQIQMFHDGAHGALVEPAPQAHVLPVPAGDVARGIERLSATEARVDRATVERVLANPFELLKNTRVVPEQRDGTVVGIRLFGVRPESLLGAIGFENGDCLESVNGLELRTPEQMMAAYARLASVSHLTVRLNRAGRTTNLDLEIR